MASSDFDFGTNYAKLVLNGLDKGRIGLLHFEEVDPPEAITVSENSDKIVANYTQPRITVRAGGNKWFVKNYTAKTWFDNQINGWIVQIDGDSILVLENVGLISVGWTDKPITWGKDTVISPEAWEEIKKKYEAKSLAKGGAIDYLGDYSIGYDSGYWAKSYHAPEYALGEYSVQKSNLTPDQIKAQAKALELSQASEELPGVYERVAYPCECYKSTTGRPYEGFLRSAIMHLNDYDKWDRNRIADWIETLDIDTTFKKKEDQNDNDDNAKPDVFY